MIVIDEQSVPVADGKKIYIRRLSDPRIPLGEVAFYTAFEKGWGGGDFTAYASLISNWWKENGNVTHLHLMSKVDSVPATVVTATKPGLKIMSQSGLPSGINVMVTPSAFIKIMGDTASRLFYGGKGLVVSSEDEAMQLIMDFKR